MVLDAAHEASGADATVPIPVVTEPSRYRVEVELDNNPDVLFVCDNVAAADRDEAVRTACRSLRAYVHSPHYLSGFHVTEAAPAIAWPRGESA